MKWWNDLWLNESFATFLSVLAQSKIPELSYFDKIWSETQHYMFWGISEDQMSSTHSICCQVNTTDEAMSNLDGITYGKGACFLKQIYHVMGHENFKKGL
jgi:aminopeptidase N